MNEIAPRAHNSGHWTINGCALSQFEQQVRAVAGEPLGDLSRHSDAVMPNLLGAEADDWRSLAREPSTALHLYGKGEARAGRKMGHVTRLYPLGLWFEFRLRERASKFRKSAFGPRIEPVIAKTACDLVGFQNRRTAPFY